ncbi:hypothetical protein JQ543_08720 [Bradyrhizobium diazoefficiens]|nr:hypothetical protein [Bradyrhizobium diazoefficiens]MBR0847825.1 hypothetical protein [Bradyrhizobium diazoefficiens]
MALDRHKNPAATAASQAAAARTDTPAYWVCLALLLAMVALAARIAVTW